MVDRRREGREEHSSEALEIVFEYVRVALRDLKFGNVTLVVQDGRVVQVDRFEKIRVKDSSH